MKISMRRGFIISSVLTVALFMSLSGCKCVSKKPGAGAQKNEIESLWAPKTLIPLEDMKSLKPEEIKNLIAERALADFAMKREDIIRGFGLPQESRKLLTDLLDKLQFPSTKVQVLRRLAEVNGRRGDFDNAIKIFKKLLEFDVDEFLRTDALLSMGNMENNRGRIDTALAAYEAVFKGATRFFNRFRALQSLHSVWYSKGQYQEFVQACDDFLKFAETSSEKDSSILLKIHQWRAEALLIQGKNPEARQELASLPKLFPGEFEAQAGPYSRRLGFEIDFRLQDWSKAADFLTQFLQKGEPLAQIPTIPGTSNVMDYVGTAAFGLAGAGQVDKARKLIELAISSERLQSNKDALSSTLILLLFSSKQKTQAIARLNAQWQSMAPIMAQKILLESAARLEQSDPKLAAEYYADAAGIRDGARPLADTAAERAKQLSGK